MSLDFSEIRFTRDAARSMMLGGNELALFHWEARPDETLKPILVNRRDYKYQQGWLPNLWGSVQSENMGPLLKNLLIISRWWQQSIQLSVGPFQMWAPEWLHRSYACETSPGCQHRSSASSFLHPMELPWWWGWTASVGTSYSWVMGGLHHYAQESFQTLNEKLKSAFPPRRHPGQRIIM